MEAGKPLCWCCGFFVTSSLWLHSLTLDCEGKHLSFKFSGIKVGKCPEQKPVDVPRATARVKQPLPAAHLKWICSPQPKTWKFCVQLQLDNSKAKKPEKRTKMWGKHISAVSISESSSTCSKGSGLGEVKALLAAECSHYRPLQNQNLVVHTHSSWRARPQIKVVFVIHTTLLLDRNVIKSFHRSGNAKIIISAVSAAL